MTLLTSALLVAVLVGIIGLIRVLRTEEDPVRRRDRRRHRSAPASFHGDTPLRMVVGRAEREDYAQQRVEGFRADMDEVVRILQDWGASVARARQDEWHRYETLTRLVGVELGREAIAVARRRLRAGATLDQAVRHAIAVVEELTADVVQRVGVSVPEWTPPEIPEDAKQADRRRRIARLRAKAESTTFPEEAASFRAKADELARRYRIPA